MSYIIYIASILDWTKSEEERLNTLMRKSIKRILGIPMNAETTRLMSLGMHNTLGNVREAQRIEQVERLTTTRPGNRILKSTGSGMISLKRDLPKIFFKHEVETYEVDAFPRNVHPQFNVRQRTARAQALLDYVCTNPGQVAFVDAAQYGRSNVYVAVVVDYKGDVLNRPKRPVKQL